jgi:dTDP-4-amino-4,6-dideoxygalactose transaminase
MTRLTKFSNGLSQNNILVQPAIAEGFVTSTLIALFDNQEAKMLLERRLLASEIDSRDWWGAGIHNMPAFQIALNGDKPKLPVTEDLASRTLGLPMYLDLSDHEIEKILKVVTD